MRLWRKRFQCGSPAVRDPRGARGATGLNRHSLAHAILAEQAFLQYRLDVASAVQDAVD